VCKKWKRKLGRGGTYLPGMVFKVKVSELP